MFFMLLGLPPAVIANTTATTVAAPDATPTQELLPAEDVFKISARFKDSKTIELTYQIADGYYLYRKRFRVSNETPQFRVGKIVSPAGKVKQDATFGRVETYRKSVRVLFPITMLHKDTGSADGTTNDATNGATAGAGANSVKLKITSQGCADVGVCYPPLQHDLTLQFGSGDTVVPVSTSGVGATPLAQSQLRTSSPPDTSRPALPVSPGVADLVKKTP